jgi:PAS domain S-box-containing protein
MTTGADRSSVMTLSAFRLLIAGSALLWTAAVLLSLWLGIQNERRQAVDLATHQALTTVQTDIGFRRWATSHGGVYVPPDEATPPNPYLLVPDRDVVTTDGKRLTLMNPAYMLRQLMQQGYVAKGRITSLKPLNPRNAPDDWEALALDQLEHGRDQVSERVMEEGQPAIRLMLPIHTEEGCLKCHGHQGYEVGDLRGGIDVTVPTAPFDRETEQEIRRLMVNHGAFWLLVTVGILGVWRLGERHIRLQVVAAEHQLITQFSVDRAFDAVFWLNPDGFYTYVNAAACALVGYDAAELRRLHVSALNPHHSDSRWLRHWAELKENGSLRFETALRRKDGAMVPVEISANYLVHGGRELDIGFVRDMTEHVAARSRIAHLTDIYSALSHTNQAIVHCRSRRQLFDLIVKIAVDYGHLQIAWIGLVDPETLDVAPVAFAGSPAGYIDGLKLSADAASPWGNGPAGRAIRANTPCIINDFLTAEITGPWHDRARIHGIKSSAAFPLSCQGKVVGLLSLYSCDHGLFTPELIELLLEMAGDISFALGRMELEAAHRRQEAENQQMVERLTASNTELERFAYVASHDLQEPLRTIVSFSQLLERQLGGGLPPEAHESFAFIVGAAKRMGLLINDLLAFSRVSSQGVKFSRLSLATACATARENLTDAIASVGAVIEQDALPDIDGDALQMMQLFQNLIGNAIKFHHPDRPPRIRIAAERQGDIWTVQVADNGIGIGKTDQDIFEIFRRLHPAAQYPGSGVGLAICKRIVTRHGGRIWVESEPGEGATFRFTLPAVGEG